MAEYDYLDDDELKRSMDPEAGSGVSLPDDEDTTVPVASDTETVQTPEKASTAEDAASDAETPELADKRRLQDIYRSALSRYGQAPRDDSEFKRLQLFGLLGQGLGQLSSGIARQQAASYFGGTADPTAVAGARAQLMQQANQAGEPIAQLAQAPVQQYIQRRQQELAAQKQGATELLDLGKAQYYANGGRQGAGTNFSPEDIANAQQTARAMGVPEEALAGVTPKNLDKIIAERGRGDRNAANLAQRVDAAEKRHQEALARIERGDRSDAAKRELSAATSARQLVQAQLRRATLAGRLGQGVVPGVEGQENYAPPQVVNSVTEKLAANDTFKGAVKDVLDVYGKDRGRAWSLLSPTDREAQLEVLMENLKPLQNSAEFKGLLTQAHLTSLGKQQEDPTGWRNLINDSRFPTKLETLVHALDKQGETYVRSKLGPNAKRNPNSPGAVKNAPAGMPGSPTAGPPNINPLPGEQAPAAAPIRRPGPDGVLREKGPDGLWHPVQQ